MIDRAKFRKTFRIFLEETTSYRKMNYYRFFLIEAVSESSTLSDSLKSLAFSSSFVVLSASKASKQHILLVDNSSDKHRSASSYRSVLSTFVTSAKEIIYSRSIESESKATMTNHINLATQAIITTIIEQISARFTQQMQNM